MKASQLIGSVLDTVVKIVVVIIVVMFTYKYAVEAYDFGYRIFADEPVSAPETAIVISMSITEDATAMDIGKVLEEKGLIEDARLFYMQELLSGHHDELKTGIYELSSDMTSKEMIEIMTADSENSQTAGEAGESSGAGGDSGLAEDGEADGSDEAAGDGEADGNGEAAGDGEADGNGEAAGSSETAD